MLYTDDAPHLMRKNEAGTHLTVAIGRQVGYNTDMSTKCRHCSYGHGCAYGPDRSIKMADIKRLHLLSKEERIAQADSGDKCPQGLLYVCLAEP